MIISIAVDCMGGDHGIKVTVPASLDFLHRNQQTAVHLVGNSDQIFEELRKHSFDESRVSVCDAKQVVTMQDEPTQALRNKKESSMRVAINLVKDGKVNAAISAGNTGALIRFKDVAWNTTPSNSLFTSLPKRTYLRSGLGSECPLRC